MATIKSYTDIEQSKKLAEILPLESADMVIWGRDLDAVAATDAQKFMSGLKDRKMNYLPCWSLAALLNILPNYTDYDTIRYPSLIKNIDNNYIVTYSALKYSRIYDNPVDACYDIILKLHELNLL